MMNCARRGSTDASAAGQRCSARRPSSTRHRMAELLEADRATEYRHADRPVALHGTHRGAVCTLRCASGARLRRRPAADGATLLHELGGVEVRGDRRGAQVIAASKKESHVEPLRGSTPPAIKRCGLRPLNTRGRCKTYKGFT